MEKTRQKILVIFIFFFLLTSCSPSQAEINATRISIAADIFATQRAKIPTATFTPIPSPTDTPTLTSTPTLATNTPLPLPEDQIAYISYYNGRYSLYLMNSDGTNKRELVTDLSGRNEEMDFAWSPDGSKIAFTGKPSGDNDDKSDIYIIDANGNNLRLLAGTEESDHRIAWSPDGQWIAFVSSNWPSKVRLYLAAVNRNWLEPIVDTYLNDDGTLVPYNFDIAHLAWSPNSRWLGFGFGDGYTGFFLRAYDMNNSGNEEVSTLANHGRWNAYPAWSPNGLHFAFSSEDGFRNELYKVSIGVDSAPIKLTNHQSIEHVNPVWSPDSQKILHTVRWDTRKWDIYIIDVDGGNLQRLTGDPSRDEINTEDYYNRYPDWSPDGELIIFESNRDDRLSPQIYVMNADGSNLRNLTNFDQASYSYPKWQP